MTPQIVVVVRRRLARRPRRARAPSPPGSLDGFGSLKSARRQDVWAQLVEYDHMAAYAGNDEASDALVLARQALVYRNRLGLRTPLHGLAWAAMREARGSLCRTVPVDHLFEILDEVRADAGCIQDGAEEATVVAQLDELEGRLEALLESRRRIDADRLAAARVRLEHLNKRVGETAERVWLRVDMERQRILLTGSLFLAVLPAAVVALTAVTTRDAAFFVAVAVFGSMGGLASALLDPQVGDLRSTSEYLRYELMFLRPLLSAAIALVAVTGVLGGAVPVLDISADGTVPEFLVVAFAAGFAERLFINRFFTVESGSVPAGDRRGADVAPAAVRTPAGSSRRRSCGLRGPRTGR